MALPTFKNIDFWDIPKALRLAGSNRRTVDQGDFSKVLRELEVAYALNPLHVRVDDHDISESIIRGQIAVNADVTAPATSVFDPLDNAVSVAVNKQPGVTFAEQIIFGASGNFQLKLTTGNTLIQTWTAPGDIGSGVGQMEITGGNKVVLHPLVPLTAATGYYVIWTAGVVRDLAGNNCAAMAVTTTWNWTTA